MRLLTQALVLLFLINLTCFCTSSKSDRSGINSVETSKKDSSLTIAFGSCNKQYKPQPLWQPIISNHPDLWIWLGDIIYSDTEDDPDFIRKNYAKQNKKKGYQALKSSTKVIGVWDDHDYGQNDGGKYYALKDSSQQILLDFLEVPKDSPRRTRKGVYSSEVIQKNSLSVKIILLDTRYHRDDEDDENPETTILGEEQWKWLKEEISSSHENLLIIGSEIQVIPKEHRFEKWENFPNEREKLLKLIATHNKPTIIISGDRHIAEISEIKLPKMDFPVLEITSSGMTHTYIGQVNETNKYRKGEISQELNFGLIKASFNKEGNLFVDMQVRGKDNKKLLEETNTY
ncbi:alkaline phosphatase D family protein [Aureibacter tunicatorum]|uniref:Alkaline phosphatase D n=1 Tax=Aureibacter tunicatorum TaxID=866807 RepID=A0AAE3XK81_9BACT|nr:alkaline phosphatase D family protein [Aureibacter tunicatorum]MDR6238158.1 alkaline phosphatase D [Aureibacter tunicatorum]BDD03191.1 hypothetical protein AUTU_06740 [Aureibacter tunicatorum]